MKVTLPLPPSTNNLYRTEIIWRWSREEGKNVPVPIRVPHGNYKKWKREARTFLAGQRIPRVPKGTRRPFSVRIKVGLNRQSDLDNRLKALMDFLVDELITPDDRWCDMIRVERGGTPKMAEILIFYDTLAPA